MTTPDPGLLAQLDILRQQFAEGLPKRLDAIDAVLDGCAASAPDRNRLTEVGALLHALAGAAGIFGFTRLGEDARRAELQITDWTESARRAGSLCTPAQWEQLRSLIRAWRNTY